MIKFPWEGAFPAFRIFGNLYFVGTSPASTHVIDTGDGLIMLDSGYVESLYLVLDGMYRMGLDPKDLRYILHTHGHIDHFGATRALVELTGAKTVIGAADRDACTNERPLSYAKELSMSFDGIFEPDILVRDGDTIRLGNTEITARATPGHTEGAMSWFFDVTDGETVYRAGLHGGMGINTMSRTYLTAYDLPFSLRDDFCASMDRLAGEPVDIFLGNHMQHNHTEEKYAKLLAGDRTAFVDPNEWGAYCRWAKRNLLTMIEQENE